MHIQCRCNDNNAYAQCKESAEDLEDENQKFPVYHCCCPCCLLPHSVTLQVSAWPQSSCPISSPRTTWCWSAGHSTTCSTRSHQRSRGHPATTPGTWTGTAQVVFSAGTSPTGSLPASSSSSEKLPPVRVSTRCGLRHVLVHTPVVPFSSHTFFLAPHFTVTSFWNKPMASKT